MSDVPPKVNYSSYLKLGICYKGGEVKGLLDCVKMLSNQPEEHLFITVHHSYEVWFKQILFDMDEIKHHLLTAINNKSNTAVRETHLGKVPVLIRRCRDLFRLILGNFEIIESISQLQFHDFREHLEGGSGFQSLQFRMIENKLGLKEKNRRNPIEYKGGFDGKELKDLEESTQGTIFELIETWLEQIYEEFDGDFVNIYKKAVSKMSKNGARKELEIVYSEENYKDHIKNAEEKNTSYFSYKAFLGALILHQFQYQPQYQTPYQIITLALDLDESIMSWRGRHVNMVHRMIGGRIGTGGTSGYSYLSSTINDGYKVFLDLFQMSSYIIPSKYFK